MIQKFVFAVLIGGFLMTSCTRNPKVETPTKYSFERNGASTVSYSGQTTRLQMATELSKYLLNLDGNSVTALEMYANETSDGKDANPFENADLNESTKSIRSKTAASLDLFNANVTKSKAIQADFSTWIEQQFTEVLVNQNNVAAKGMAGQILDGDKVRYVNKDGLELNQIVAKGLIGALMLDQIVNGYLSNGVLDAGSNRAENDKEVILDKKTYTNMEHKWDEAYGYLFGMAKDGSDPLATLGKDDAFLNKYVEKVNANSNFKTYAQSIFDAFALGRAAIVAKEYEIRDEQSLGLKRLLSDVIGVRAVYYLMAGKKELEQTPANYGSAFHDLSEAYGFIYSLRFAKNKAGTGPRFSHDEVDAMLAKMLPAEGGLWVVQPSELEVVAKSIAEKFDFTVDQAK